MTDGRGDHRECPFCGEDVLYNQMHDHLPCDDVEDAPETDPGLKVVE